MCPGKQATLAVNYGLNRIERDSESCGGVGSRGSSLGERRFRRRLC